MHCCIPTPTTDSNTSTGMIWVTLNILSAAEEFREQSGNFTLSGEWLPCIYYFLTLMQLQKLTWKFFLFGEVINFIGCFYVGFYYRNCLVLNVLRLCDSHLLQ